MTPATAHAYVMECYRKRHAPDWRHLSALLGEGTEADARAFQLRVIEAHLQLVPWSRTVAEKPAVSEATRAKLRANWERRRQKQDKGGRE